MEHSDSHDGKRILVHVDPELEDLIPSFLENRQGDVKTINEAIEAGDFEKARIIGHSMKGSGGGYGFDAITEIGGKIEAAAQKGDANGIKKCVEALSSYLENIDIVYEE